MFEVMNKRLKNYTWKHFIAVIITAAFLCLTLFLYDTALFRLRESVVAFIDGFIAYFKGLVGIEIDPDSPVLKPSNVVFPVQNDYIGFVESIKAYWQHFTNKNIFLSYLLILINIFIYGTSICILSALFLICLLRLFKRVFYRANNDFNKDSKPLLLYKKFKGKVLIPLFNILKNYIDFLCENGKILKLWLFIWLINTNILSILFSAIGFLLYFSISFCFDRVPEQLYKLFLDLTLTFDSLPRIFWVVIGLIVFDVIRKHIALNRLRRYEGNNMGFLSVLPISILINGNMGKGKTTLMVDMMLTQRVSFINRAKEILDNCALKFPNFPWISFELDIRKGLEEGYIFSLASVVKYVVGSCMSFDRILASEDLKSAVEKHNRKHPERKVKDLYWGYNTEIFSMEYNDELGISSLQSVLCTYAQAYFIYICSNFSLSNISVRFDDVLVTQGNFPIWDSDFFTRDPRGIEDISRYAKILDQDMLRLGKQIFKDNPNAGSLEFGSLAMTELGKERLNQVEQQGIKKNSSETNQKNDLFNYFIKMCRHPSTVEHYPFFRFFADEQRAMSLGADLRELCILIDIQDKSEDKIALRFFFLEDMICDFVYKRFIKIYTNFRFYRGDNTLLMHFIKNAAAAFNNYKVRRYNRFGFNKLQLKVEQGTLDGESKLYRYYLMPKKVYSNRFSTDCYSEYFRARSLKTRIGMNDYTEYEGVKATTDELKAQHSYFINDLEKNVGSDE